MSSKVLLPASGNHANAGGSLQGKRAAVLLYSEYPFDVRPRRAAEALVESGMEVDLFCLCENDSEKKREVINGVNVRRLPFSRTRGGKTSYICQYLEFFILCSMILISHLFTRRYALIHVHNMPDFLVFSTFLSKLFGAKVILDMHDPMPELYQCIFGLQSGHWILRLLEIIERRSIRFSHLTLTPNIAFRNVFISRGCPPDKIHIMMNSPEEAVFNETIEPYHDEKSIAKGQTFQVLYHGSLVRRHGLDRLVEAIAMVRESIHDIKLIICGSKTPFLDSVLSDLKDKGLDTYIQYLGVRSQKEIASIIASCNLGVVPNHLSAFTEINLPTRIFEFIAMKKPVIAPSTRGIRDYFNDSNMFFFKPDDTEDLARMIQWVYSHPAEAQAIVEQGRNVYKKYLWSLEKMNFIDLVKSLVV